MEASLRLARLCRLQAAQRLTAWLKRRAKTGGLRPQPPNTKKRRNGAWSASQQLQATGVAGCVRSWLLAPHPSPRNGRNASGAGGGPPVSPQGVALLFSTRLRPLRKLRPKLPVVGRLRVCVTRVEASPFRGEEQAPKGATRAPSAPRWPAGGIRSSSCAWHGCAGSSAGAPDGLAEEQRRVRLTGGFAPAPNTNTLESDHVIPAGGIRRWKAVKWTVEYRSPLAGEDMPRKPLDSCKLPTLLASPGM